MPEQRIIGIDLGTSNSCVAYCKDSRPEVIVNPLGARVTPSVVAYRDDGSVIVGDQARRQAIMNPAQTVGAVKRLVGRQFDSHEVKAIRAVSPYDVVKARNGDAWVQVAGREISPPEVQAHILVMLKQAASAFFESPITDAVITVPAFFDETQRQATRDAAEIAGMRARRILSESTAAALAYGYGGAASGRGRIAVVDLGGGTLDVTLMIVDNGVFTTMATAGDMLLGGADFDRAVALRFAKEIEEAHDVNVMTSPVALQRLIGEAEEAKKTLTERGAVEISLPFLAEGPNGPINFERKLSREEFAEIVEPLISRIARPCDTCLNEAGLTAGDIDDVLLIGGMTRTDVVQKKIEKIFGRTPQARINPDEAVAMGASVLGAVLAGSTTAAKFVDVAPRTLGVKAAGDRFVPLIKKSSPLPARVIKSFRSKAGSNSIQIELLQGEEAQASRNRRLAWINLENLPGGGQALKLQLEVTDEGLMQATSTLVDSGQAVSVRIEPSSGLGRGEVERLSLEFSQLYGDEIPPPLEEAAASGGFAVNLSTPVQAASPPPSPSATPATTRSAGAASPPPAKRALRTKPATSRRSKKDAAAALAAIGGAPESAGSAPATPPASASESATATSPPITSDPRPAAPGAAVEPGVGPGATTVRSGAPRWLLYLVLVLALALGGAVAVFSFLR